MNNPIVQLLYSTLASKLQEISMFSEHSKALIDQVSSGVAMMKSVREDMLKMLTKMRRVKIERDSNPRRRKMFLFQDEDVKALISLSDLLAYFECEHHHE